VRSGKGEKDKLTVALVVNWNVTEADKMNLGVDSKDTGLEFDFSGVKYVADTNCQLAVFTITTT